MIAGRSNTRMDSAFLATPGTGLGRVSRVGNARLGSFSRMGYLGGGDEFADFYGPEADFGMTFDWTAEDGTGIAAPAPAPVPLPATLPGSSGWDWQGALKQAPAMIRDLYVAKQTGDYQAKLNDVNIDRAKRGLPALPSNYAPQVNVGVAPGTAKLAGMGVGTLALAALAAAFVLRGGARRSRRRR